MISSQLFLCSRSLKLVSIFYRSQIPLRMNRFVTTSWGRIEKQDILGIRQICSRFVTFILLLILAIEGWFFLFTPAPELSFRDEEYTKECLRKRKNKTGRMFCSLNFVCVFWTQKTTYTFQPSSFLRCTIGKWQRKMWLILHLTYFSVKKQQLCRSMLMMMTTSTCKEVGIHLLADYLRLVTSLKLQKEENFLQHWLFSQKCWKLIWF